MGGIAACGEDGLGRVHLVVHDGQRLVENKVVGAKNDVEYVQQHHAVAVVADQCLGAFSALGGGGEVALEWGMQEKSAEFVATGAQVYREDDHR